MLFPEDPIRVIAIADAVAGDTWAQPGSQVVPSEEAVPRLKATGVVRWRAIAYDGDGLSAKPIDGDTTAVNMVVAKVRGDGADNETLARAVAVSLVVGAQYTEPDISAGEIFIIGVVDAVDDGATAIKVFVDAGAGRL